MAPYWYWLWCPGFSPVLVSITLSFSFHTLCFPFDLICHWISIVFLLYGGRIANHSVDPSLTFLGEFPGLGLALVPELLLTPPLATPTTSSPRPSITYGPPPPT